MIAFLLAVQVVFPPLGPTSMRVDGGRWNLVDVYRDTVVERWCCVEIHATPAETISTWVRNPDPLVQRFDTVQLRSARVTVRDYAYYGYEASYDAFNPLPAPGDTVSVSLAGPRVLQGPLYFPLDSIQTRLVDAVAGDTLSQGLLTAFSGDTVFVNDTLFVIRPQPGDSLVFQGQVRIYAGGQDSLVVSGLMTIFSDSLVFPVLSDSITIDTLGFADALTAPGDLVASAGGLGARGGDVAASLPTAGRDDLRLDQALAGGMAGRRDSRHDRPAVRAAQRWGGYAGGVPATRGRFDGGDGVLSTVHESRRATPGAQVQPEYDYVLLARVPESVGFGRGGYDWGSHGVA